VAGKIISAQSNVTDSFLTPKASLPVRYASPSLQIVNPDSLGVHLPKRRHRDGIDSPFTPWDWQLKALVRYDYFSKPPVLKISCHFFVVSVCA
jgi:hypothetical protein